MTPDPIFPTGRTLRAKQADAGVVMQRRDRDAGQIGEFVDAIAACLHRCRL
jgi:hypothetical protein